MITERTIHRCTLFTIFAGLFTIILMVVAIAMPYWSTGTFVSDDYYFTSSSFHAGLFVYCPNNSTRGVCTAWDGNNQRTDALCYNYYSSDSNYQDMCNNIFSAQALSLTAISILFIAWIVRLCALCCCPITWGRPRCCVRSCSSIAIAFIVFLGLMLAVAAESLWSAAMTDLEVDTTIYSQKPNLSVDTNFGTSFILMSLGTTICMMWLCTEVYMISTMLRNRNGYQVITDQTPLLVNTGPMPPPYSPSTMVAAPPGYHQSVNAGAAGTVSVNAPQSMPRAPVTSSSSSSSAAAAAAGGAAGAAGAAVAGGVEPSAPAVRKRFCGSCGVEVSSKFCPECGSPAM